MLGTRESFIVRFVGILFTLYECPIFPANHTAVLKATPFSLYNLFCLRLRADKNLSVDFEHA
jgi:hypothetical protein